MTISGTTVTGKGGSGSNDNKGVLHSLQSWSLAITWFNVISKTLVVGGLTHLKRCSRCIL